MVTNNLVICTARYSDNLGDGVIAECFEQTVRKYRPHIKTQHIDIAGRTTYNNEQSAETYQKKRIFYRTPTFLRPVLMVGAWAVFMRGALLKAWRDQAPQEPFQVVFAGGQVLNDVALNFPLKVALCVREAERRGGSVAFSAVGVSANWSLIGRLLFRRALGSKAVLSISVRDRASLDHLAAQAPARAKSATMTTDPGVLAAEAYTIGPASKSQAVGLGVAHPRELATQAENAGDFTETHAFDFWERLAEGLAAHGLDPVLFTNGSAEDEAFLERLCALKPRLKRAPRPRTPEDLVRQISRFKLLIAYRLHANIVAFSLKIPTVSLAWDKKVRAFAQLAGREKFCLSSHREVEDIVGVALEALATGVDTHTHKRLTDTARADLLALVDRLTERGAR